MMAYGKGPWIVFAFGTASTAWGCLEHRAYWTALSILVAIWSLWMIHARVMAGTVSWSSICVTVSIVPVMGALLGQGAMVPLEALAAPILLYLLCISIIMPTLGTSRSVGPRGLALLSCIAPISIGTAVLLALYHLGMVFSVPLIESNPWLMWNLISLLGLSFLLAQIYERRYLSERSWGEGEASG